MTGPLTLRIVGIDEVALPVRDLDSEPRAAGGDTGTRGRQLDIHDQEKQRNLAEAFDAPATDHAADTRAVAVDNSGWAGCWWRTRLSHTSQLAALAGDCLAAW